MKRGLHALGMTALVALSGFFPASAAGASGGNSDEIDTDVAARQTEWWLSGLGVSAAQQAGHGGAGVKVCLVDTGVDPSQPDLKGADLSGGKNFSGHGAANGLEPDDAAGQPEHGTTMAAWIVGQGHGPGHAKGVLGVAPKATLMSVSAGESNATTAAAVRYCVDHGAKVINSSTTYQPPPDLMSYVLAHDAVMVSGAGNVGEDSSKSCAGMGGLQLGQLTVGGVSKGNKVSPLSCTNADAPSSHDGPNNTRVTGVALGAPSNGGVKPDGSTFPLVAPVPQEYGYYRVSAGGTSTAAALTSGVVALVRAAHPELRAGDVINRLIRTASPVVGAPSGVHGPVGFGVVNASAAVSASVPSVHGANPMGDPATGATGLWTNPNWNGSDQGAAAASSKGSSPSGGSSWVLWAAVGVVVVGGAGIAAVVAASRKRGA